MASRRCASCLELLPRRWAPIGTPSLHSAHRRAIQRSSLASRPRIQQQQQQARSFQTTTIRHKDEAAASEGSDGIASKFKELLGGVVQGTKNSYEVYSSTDILYKACAKEADYKISEQERKDEAVQLTADGEELGVGGGMWHDDFKLPATFSTWSQVTMLHMYLFMVRMRNLDKEQFQAWQTQLIDHFFNDAELRMDIAHNIGSRAVRQRYLRDLFLNWRGIIVAYDEGLVKGDAVLASAVWRNLFRGSEDVDLRVLAAVVSWMRLTLRNLDQMQDMAIMQNSLVALKWPAKSELRLVDQPTKGLDGVEMAESAAAGIPLGAKGAAA